MDRQTVTLLLTGDTVDDDDDDDDTVGGVGAGNTRRLDVFSEAPTIQIHTPVMGKIKSRFDSIAL